MQPLQLVEHTSLYKKKGCSTSLSFILERILAIALVIKVLYALGLHKVMIHSHTEIPCIQSAWKILSVEIYKLVFLHRENLPTCTAGFETK